MNKEIKYTPEKGINFSDLDKKPEIAPGSFRFSSPGEVIDNPPLEQAEMQLEISPSSVEVYQTFAEKFKPKTTIIYYPSCGYDISPDEAFPNSRVIHVDSDPDVIKMLQDKGYEAVLASSVDPLPGASQDIIKFEPVESPDIVILMNPQTDPKTPALTVKGGGFVLCNNWHDTATIMKQNFDFIQRAKIDNTYVFERK